MTKISNDWYVYIILSTDDLLYTGITTDVQRRWYEHSSKSNGAKFFRGRKPKKLMYVSNEKNRSIASKLEIAIKKLARKEKLEFIASKRNEIESMTFELRNK